MPWRSPVRVTRVLVVCISALRFNNVTSKWIPEIAHHAAGVPFVLVGTKADLRDDDSYMASHGDSMVKTEEGKALADKVKAAAYVECSALTQTNLKSVFDTAIHVAMSSAATEKKTAKKNRCAIL